MMEQADAYPDIIVGCLSSRIKLKAENQTYGSLMLSRKVVPP